MPQNDYDIKMDGEKAAFDGGATRYTKTGKGRFDLIPENAVHAFIKWVLGVIANDDGCIKITRLGTISDAYTEGVSRYYNTIANITALKYSGADFNPMTDNKVEITKAQFVTGISNMLKALAVHYEKGAMAYGVDNWKKGIPVIGGDRGGSFTDSMLRHLSQFLSGETDEKHDIAAIWNAFGALYYLLADDH